MTRPHRRFSRRQVLLTAATSALVGACSSLGSADADPPPSEASSPRSEPPATTTGPTTTGPTTTGPTTTGPAPDLESRFAGRTPHEWGTHLPGIHTTVPTVGTHPTLALTFDACGGEHGSLVDVALLDTLRRENIPATLFLNERWVLQHPSMTRTLASDPLFRIGNHGTRHVPLSVGGRAAYGIAGTADVDGVVQEVLRNQRTLADVTGIEPTWFRAGTAHYDEVAVEIATELGVLVAGFAVNGDGGATYTPQQVAGALTGAPDGAIVLMHMNQPFGGTGAGLRAALPELRARGVRFTHLSPAAGT